MHQARLSERTVKLEGYKAKGRPKKEDSDTKWWRERFIPRIIMKLWQEKKELLAPMSFPPRPIHQNEIIREARRQIAMMKQEKVWRHKSHGHNWIERRTNYCATQELGPKTYEGALLIVNYTAGLYGPNPEVDENRIRAILGMKPLKGGGKSEVDNATPT